MGLVFWGVAFDIFLLPSETICVKPVKRYVSKRAVCEAPGSSILTAESFKDLTA